MTLDRSRNRIEIRRVISVGQDRKTGEAVIRAEGPAGRSMTLRVHPSQLRALATGVMGLAEARSSNAWRIRATRGDPFRCVACGVSSASLH